MNRTDVLKPFSEALDVSIKDLTSSSRKRSLADARKIICYELRKRKLTLTDIGFVLKRDHTTVIYCIQTYIDNYQFSPRFRDLAEKAHKLEF